MNPVNIESGLELFHRAKQESSITDSNLQLFEKGGPYVNDFVEIKGEPSCGKTFILMNFIIRCALPKEHNGVALPGKDCHVIFINCDHKFEFFKMIMLIEGFLLRTVPNVKKEVQNIIKLCLKNISIMNCYDNNQYLITLHNLERIIPSDKMTVIAIDSLCPYYWANRLDFANTSYISYYSSVLSLLKNIVKFRSVIYFFTTDYDFKMNSDKLVQKIDYCLRVNKSINNTFIVNLVGKQNNYNFCVSLDLEMKNISEDI